MKRRMVSMRVLDAGEAAADGLAGDDAEEDLDHRRPPARGKSDLSMASRQHQRCEWAAWSPTRRPLLLTIPAAPPP
jgi:hypothetical protein